jgi:acetyltransferase-like isoleucine patch superfamily enzyme
MKYWLKSKIRNFLLKFPYINKLREEGYLSIPFNLLVVNFLFQRIFGINRFVPFSTHYTSCVDGAQNLKIGRRVHVSFAVSGGCYISATNGLEIGDDSLFAPNVVIQSLNHDLYLREIPTREQPVRIGRNCWIGANVVITAGVQIGDHVTIGAGSVITKDLPDFAVAAGNPCRVLKLLSREVLDDYRKRHNVLLPKTLTQHYPPGL